MQQNPLFRQTAWTYEPRTTSISPYYREFPDYIQSLTGLYMDYLPEQPLNDFPMFKYKYNFPSEYELGFSRKIVKEKYINPENQPNQAQSQYQTTQANQQQTTPAPVDQKLKQEKQQKFENEQEKEVQDESTQKLNQYQADVANIQNILHQQQYVPQTQYNEGQFSKNNCPQSLDYKCNLPSFYQDKFYDDVQREKNSALSQGRQAYIYQPDYVKNYQPREEYQDWEDFFNIFCQMLDLENQCEELKVILFMEPQFSMKKLWIVFDRVPKTIKAKNVIIHDEFVKGCQYFRFTPDPFDIKLLMTKYASSNDLFTFYKNTELTFQEFANIFYPLSKGELFRGTMNQQGKDEKFGHTEYDIIMQLLKLMASQEDVYEYHKKQIKQRNIDLEWIYYILNTDRNFKLTSDEIRSHLIVRNLLYSNDELIPFFRRFDRDCKGYITLEDFKQMMEPRIQLANRRPIQNEIQKILYGDDQ